MHRVLANFQNLERLAGTLKFQLDGTRRTEALGIKNSAVVGR